MSKYQLFVSTEDKTDNFERLDEIEEDLVMLNGCMNREDSFVILKNGKYYCKGKFNKEKYKLRKNNE